LTVEERKDTSALENFSPHGADEWDGTEAKSWSAQRPFRGRQQAEMLRPNAPQCNTHRPNKKDGVVVQTESLPSNQSKAIEKHFQVPEIAKLWSLSEDSVRSLFKGEPGVLVIARPGTSKKRKYVSMRVPESVLHRVHRRLSARAA
jgi:hypothetical protein